MAGAKKSPLGEQDSPRSPLCREDNPFFGPVEVASPTAEEVQEFEANFKLQYVLQNAFLLNDENEDDAALPRLQRSKSMPQLKLSPFETAMQAAMKPREPLILPCRADRRRYSNPLPDLPWPKGHPLHVRTKRPPYMRPEDSPSRELPPEPQTPRAWERSEASKLFTPPVGAMGFGAEVDEFNL